MKYLALVSSTAFCIAVIFLVVPRRPAPTSHYDRMIGYHIPIVQAAPDECVLFIGDSRVQALCTAAVCEKSINFGIGSDTTDGVLRRLPLYAPAIERSRGVVLAIGLNDLPRLSDSQIIESIRKCCDVIGPGAVLCGIIPVDEHASGRMGDNARIAAINDELSKLDGVRFVPQPFGSALDSGFHAGDGVHLNADGYRLWIQAIRSAIKKPADDKSTGPLCTRCRLVTHCVL